MKTRFYIPFLFVVVLVGLLAGCSAKSTDKNVQLEKLKGERAKLDGEIRKLETELNASNPEPAAVKSREVGVTELVPQKFDYYVQTQGNVEAIDNILVSAKTVGVLSSVYAREGEVVKKGQVLGQIDNSVIVSSIDELKSSIELANTVYQRQKNLWDQKIGTEVQYLQAKNSKESLEKRLATLNEQLEMSRIKSPLIS